jgi:hypothetical protein
MMGLAWMRYRNESNSRGSGRRRGLAVIASVLTLATGAAHAQNLTDAQVALVSADLASAATLR